MSGGFAHKMKYTHLIVGIILFSGMLYILFFAAADIGKEYNSKDYKEYSRLASTYVNETEMGTDENGTLVKIQNKLDAAEFSLVSAAVGAIDSVLQGAKLLGDSIGTTARVAEQVRTDSQGVIHPIIPKIIKSIIAVTIIIIILILFIKVKPET